MKYFIKRLFIFSIPIILLSIPIDLFISYFFRQQNKIYSGELEIWKDIYDCNIKADIAIMGSSRAWIHINPEVLGDSLNKSVYNFGLDGHNFWLQNFRNLEYLKCNTKPETIIVSVDVYTLTKRQDLYRYQQFLPHMLWDADIYEYTNTYKGFHFLDYVLPLVRYYGETGAALSPIKSLFNNDRNKKLRKNGFRGMDRAWNSDLAKAKLGMGQLTIEIKKETVKLFDQFIQECKQNNIEVLLVYTPEYIEGQNFVANRKEIFDTFYEISNKNKITFYDYSHNSISYNKTLFYNASHLNQEGAKVFSQRLANDLKNRPRHENIDRKP
jgi:hypothetical protein